MTLASDIIQRAYREHNLRATGVAPSDAEQAEGLVLLNGILAAVPGFSAGRELNDINIGGQFDCSNRVICFVPENARLVLNLGTAQTFKLHPRPYDGQRLAVADAGAELATYNVVLDGNGRTIEGAATVTLNTNGLARQWLYRADLADWKRLTDLALTDAMPFPTEFDDYFVLMLALRLSPRQGPALRDESKVWLDRLETQLAARYRRPRPTQVMPTWGLLGQRGYVRGDRLW